jgi:hypothetical protein
MQFHTVGDSHSTACYSVWTFQVNDKPIAVHHVGPRLMNSFNSDPIGMTNLQRDGVVSGDWVCFCFGEIDVRCHVHRFVSDGHSFKDVIDKLILGYANAILAATEFATIHACVFMIPPVRSNVFWNDPPPQGSDLERKAYTAYFNAELDKMCSKHGFHFISAFEDYVDADGYLDASKSDYCVHLKYSQPIERIVRALIINEIGDK